jgi:hypothetical protein
MQSSASKCVFEEDFRKEMRIERFCDVVVHSRLKTADSLSLKRIGRDRDDANLLPAPASVFFDLADVFCGFIPIHARHLAIHQYGIKVILFKLPDSIDSVRG